jgi:ArsR family metal-binding transcriptional regulator
MKRYRSAHHCCVDLKGGAMLLTGYRKEIFRAKCNPGFESVHCYAHLNDDIGEVIPYLNAELGGSRFTKEPVSVTFQVHGKLIAVHPDKIAVNALKDEAEADGILEWLRREINDIWNRRDEIEPSFDSPEKPKVLEILKLLPKTNCKECGQPTCMVFAARATEGVVGASDCPQLNDENKSNLESYLGRFRFDIDQ